MAQHIISDKSVRQVLATLCGLQPIFVENLLEIPVEFWYREFFQPKKRGGFRTICEPCDELKIVQGAFLDYLYRRWVVDKRFFGGIPKKSIVDNASCHIRWCEGVQCVPLSMFHLDLKDAYPSAKDGYLREMFMAMFSHKKFARLAEGSGWSSFGLQDQFVELLLMVTTHQGCLPQGASTSNYLLAMLLNYRGLLKKMDEYMENREFKVSVFVDDITVSSVDSMSWRFRKLAMKAVEETGFSINHKKTRYNEVAFKAHVVSGVSLVPGDGRVNLAINKKFRKFVRGKLHQASVLLENNPLPTNLEDLHLIDQANGFMGHIIQVYGDELMPSDIRGEVARFCSARSKHNSTKRDLRWNF